MPNQENEALLKTDHNNIESIVTNMLSCIAKQDYTGSISLGLQGIRKNPFYAAFYFHLGYSYGQIGQPIKAYQYTYMAFTLDSYVAHREEDYPLFSRTQPAPDAVLKANAAILDEYLTAINIRLDELENTEQYAPFAREASDMLRERQTSFCFSDNTFRNYTEIIGDFYQDYGKRRVYVGRYRDYVWQRLAGKQGKNIIDSKAELLPLTAVTNDIQWNASPKQPCLLPVLSKEINAINFATTTQVENVIQQSFPEHFNYYRLEEPTRLTSLHPMYIGNPIPLYRHNSNKQLVLSIFIDGLTQQFLNRSGKETMPNTYAFFSKGVFCTNAFADAEWTYPSIATYVSGLFPIHHGMVHNKWNTCLPEDTTILYEYFKAAGYYTAKLDGNWRDSPNYGYLRGIDRTIYQHQHTGMNVRETISDTIDHLKMSYGTSQYVWMGIPDLHDIADNYDLPDAVQAHLPISVRTRQETGPSSVKQFFNPHKQEMYRQMLSYIDEQLGILYQFIETHYCDEDIVISLFSDHGQGYFVEEDAHFMSPGRSNIVFAFRGSKASQKSGICEEYITTADYLPILCHLSGIPLKGEPIDGRLPKYFGGATEREYVIASSLHPGDPYQAAIYTKAGAFYYRSKQVIPANLDIYWDVQDCYYVPLPPDAKNHQNYRTSTQDKTVPYWNSDSGLPAPDFMEKWLDITKKHII